MSFQSQKKGNYDKRRYYSSTKVPRKPEVIKRMDAQFYEKTIHDLIEKIDLLETKLKSTGLDKIKLVTSHQMIKLNNDILKEEVETTEKKNAELNNENIFSKRNLETMKKNFSDFKSGYEYKFELMLKELQQKNEEIDNLFEKLKKRDEELLNIKMNNDLTIKEMDKQLNEIAMLKLNSKNDQKKIDSLEKELNRLCMDKRSEGNLLMENKHLKDDNVKLLELLSVSPEFGDFAYLHQSLPGGIRYVTEMDLPIGPRARREAIKMKLKNIYGWVPGKAYEVVLELNTKYELNMDETIINELLGNLNRIYREKEENNINKIISRYQNQILNLMNKYGIRNINCPYNLVEVEKIKKQVDKREKADQKKNSIKKKLDEDGNEIVNFAKTAAADFFFQHKKQLDDQIDDLQEKLSVRTNDNNMLSAMSKIDIVKNGFYQNGKEPIGVDIKTASDLYFDKAFDEFNSINESLEGLINEYRKRVKDSDLNFGNENVKPQNSGIKVMKTSIEWLISSMKGILEDSKNRFLEMKENKNLF